MYPYPPWHPDWRWGDVGTLFCPLIFPAMGLLIAAIIIFRTTTGARRFKLFAVAVAIALCWPLLPWPVVANARTAAERTLCRNNLQWIGLAIHESTGELGQLPPPTVSPGSGSPLSWRVELLPQLSKERPRRRGAPNVSDLAAGYNRARAWNDSANLQVAQRQPPLYWCPANRTPQDSQQRWYSAYAFLTGPSTAFPADGPLTLGKITDGISNTLLVVEACGQNIVWIEPRDVDVSREAVQINAPGNQPGTSSGIGSSYHGGGAQMALADGSVRFLSERISPDVLQKLTTAAAGESITNNEF